MFRRWKLYRQFRKEVDKTTLYNQAVVWTKDYFKKRGVPTWSSEYQNTFTAHTMRYMNSYLHTYAKRRVAEHLALTSK
jgi:hypothetical protein